MDAGLQFHLPSHRDVTTRDLVEVAAIAEGGGISQLWTTDNLQSRNTFVVLAALASSTSLRLGTAVMVQYFRNPVDVAASLSAITEIMSGSELSVGIGRGNITTSYLIETPRPLTIMKETAIALRRLLDGEEIHCAAMPALAAYFNLAQEAVFRLGFSPARDVLLYCGGDGPLSLELGGRYMDGLLCGTMFRPLALMGHLGGLLARFDAAALEAGRLRPVSRVAEIKIALSSDAAESRWFARQDVANRVLGLRWRGFSTESIARLGISDGDMDRLQSARASASDSSVLNAVTDEMIDAFYIAGDIGYCVEQVSAMKAIAIAHGFTQIMFSGISRDLRLGTHLLTDRILPALH